MTDVFEFERPSKKRVIYGYNPVEDNEDSSDDEDMFVVRYAKKAKKTDVTEAGKWKDDPVSLVNQFLRDICPFDAADVWQFPQVGTTGPPPPPWDCVFTLPAFNCLEKNTKKLVRIEPQPVQQSAHTKNDAKRAVAKVVLKEWQQQGLITPGGALLVVRAPITKDDDEVPTAVTSGDLSKMIDQGCLRPLVLHDFVRPEHVKFVTDVAGANEVIKQLDRAREHLWSTSRKKLVVAIDAEWRPFMAHRDEKGSSGGPASMLQLCFREPAVDADAGPLHVALFHLPRIGALYAEGRATPAPGGTDGNLAFDAACRKACELALAGLVPAFLQDEDIVKVGVNVYSDARKLQESLPANTLAIIPKDAALPGDQDKFAGFEDLQSWARQCGFKVTGLENLLAILCKLRVNKVLTQAEWDWERATLLERQREYAACDVLATYLVYEELKDRENFGCG